MHPLGPFAEIDRPNGAQIMATLQVRGRARWYPAGKSGDNRRMALLISGLALFIVVHLVPTRPSLRAGLALIRGAIVGYHMAGARHPQCASGSHVVFLDPGHHPAGGSLIRTAVGHPMLTALMGRSANGDWRVRSFRKTGS
jgi:hypothetical protein